MSIRVLMAKYNAKVKAQQVNSREPFALNFSNRGGLIGRKCCGTGKDKQIPSNQQGYGIYMRRSMMNLGGMGGPASRVSEPNANSYNVVKRAPKFSSQNYIENKRSKVIRYTNDPCSQEPNTAPDCYNINNGKCVSSKHGRHTKDLGFLSSSDYIKRKTAKRVKDICEEYESPLMSNNNCS